MEATVAHVYYFLLLIRAALQQPPDIFARRDVKQKSVSFAAGGFNLAYAAGALKSIQRHKEFDDVVYLGNSTGAIVAACAASGVKAGDLCRVLREFNITVRRNKLCRQHLVSQAQDALLEILPPDAWKRCSGKLRVAYTNIDVNIDVNIVHPLELTVLATWPLAMFAAMFAAMFTLCYHPVLLLLFHVIAVLWTAVRVNSLFFTEFTSNRDLVAAVACSMSIPGVQDNQLRRTSRGGWGVDGALTCRYPMLAESTIVVDWKKTKNNSGPLANIFPSVDIPSRIATPPTESEFFTLVRMGEEDAQQYLAHRPKKSKRKTKKMI